MSEERPKSFLVTHPTLRNAFRVVVVVAALAVLAAIFGPDKVWGLFEPIAKGMASLFGVGNSAPVEVIP